jgi:hypothetical protein
MAPAHDPLAALPHAACLKIFAAVTPVAARARCALVSPLWRAKLADRSLRQELDFAENNTARVSEAALRGAAARGGGQLRTLRLWHTSCDGRRARGRRALRRRRRQRRHAAAGARREQHALRP